jgi:peptide/nickel transport system permease protein
MLSFIGRSVIQKTVTLFFVSVVSFLIIHLAPGNPSQVDPMNPKFTPEMVERFQKEFHSPERRFHGRTIKPYSRRYGSDF